MSSLYDVKDRRTNAIPQSDIRNNRAKVGKIWQYYVVPENRE